MPGIQLGLVGVSRETSQGWVQVRGLGQRATGSGPCFPEPSAQGKVTAKRNAAGKAARPPPQRSPKCPSVSRSRSRRQGPFLRRARGLSENSGLSIYTQGVQRGAESCPGNPGHSPDQKQASWLRPDRGRPPSLRQASAAAERQRGFLCPTGYILFSVPKCHGCSCQGAKGNRHAKQFRAGRCLVGRVPAAPGTGPAQPGCSRHLCCCRR